jgi:hypothetical protein
LGAAAAGEGSAGRVADVGWSAAGAGAEFWATELWAPEVWVRTREVNPAQTMIARNNFRLKAGADARLNPVRVKPRAN